MPISTGDEMKSRSWRLDESTYSQVPDAVYRVAVLPFGATEPHNLHLPYGTDCFEATVIGDHVCEAASKRGAKVVLLPTTPFGVQTNMRRLPLAINVNPATLDAWVTDVIDSLIASGIHKILILNSHGGNDFKPLLRTLAGKDIQVFLCDWFQMVKDVYFEIFEQPEDHAGEMETSLALAYFPQLVMHKDDGQLAADSGQTNPTRFPAVNQGWVQITRRWDLLTTNTGSGDPHAASAEKGRQVMQVIEHRLADFLVELDTTKLDEQFPF